jgi:hypothetical protein
VSSLFRDCHEVQAVDVGGAHFMIARLPEAKWRDLMIATANASRAANRRAMLHLRGEGVEAPTSEEVRTGVLLDAKYLAEIEDIQREAVRWAVRGHEGAPFPFVGEEREFRGRKYPGPSDDTIALYGESLQLLDALYYAVRARSVLTDPEKKSSPQP